MQGKQIIAEIELAKGRLYLIHKRNGRETSKTDVTAVWHFFKEVEAYHRSKSDTGTSEKEV